MPQATRKVEYALTALAHIASQKPGTIVTARGIAGHYGIPPKLLAKVLYHMGKSGVICPHQGKRGGYSLSRNPSELTLADVVEILEKTPELMICADGAGAACQQFDSCNIREAIDNLNGRLRAFFSTVTLRDFVANNIPAVPSEGE